MFGDGKILVTGMGRCGSSLVMQMFRAIGFRVPGAPPFFEQFPLLMRDGWLDEYDVYKWLDPARHEKLRPPGDYVYRAIWLDRDHKEQRKSWKKMNDAIGRKVTNVQIAMLEERKRLGLGRVRGLGVLRDLCDGVLVTSYEKLKTQPRLWVHEVNEFLELGLRDYDVSMMLNAMKNRETKALPVLLEREELPR